MRPDTCKYFNGIQHGKCDAEVPYDKWRRDNASLLNTMPCFTRNDQFGCRCPHRKLPTMAEMEAYEAETEKIMENALELDRLVGKHSSGSFPCKVCGEGTVTYKIVGPLQGVAACDKCDWRMIS